MEPDGAATVRLKAPPQAGQANAALLAFLAQTFGVPKSRVTLLNGPAFTFKKLEVEGLSATEIQTVLVARRIG